MKLFPDGSKRRRLILIGSFILGLSWIGGVIASERMFRGKTLWLMNSDVDEGAFMAGDLIAHRAWIANPTSQILSIRAEPTCGCVLPTFKADKLAPFALTPVDIQIETFGKRVGFHEEMVQLILQSDQGSWTERLKIKFEIVSSKDKS
ncbi:MAG: hypothetical protein KIT45_12020 [Fimbriimonadia bacterium]|nr:hypothetical protein [Fimbriimonadia bacterium]